MSLLGQAREAYVKKNYSEASKLYEKSIHLLLKQNNKRLKARLAFLAESLAQSSRAEFFERLGKENPQLEEFIKRLAKRAKMAPTDSLEELLFEVLPLLPQKQRAPMELLFYQQLIEGYKAHKDANKALKKCHQALRVFPNDPQLNAFLHFMEPTSFVPNKAESSHSQAL